MFNDDLLLLYEECSCRRLNDAAKWAAEMVLCLPPDSCAAPSSPVCAAPKSPPAVDAALRMALTCVDCREFGRAAEVAAQTTLGTPYAHFVRLFAFYLDGEKRRLDDMADVNSNSAIRTTKYDNDALTALQTTLQRITMADGETPDDPYLLYLYGLVLRDRELSSQATEAFVSSVRALPWFWPAWYALSRLIHSNQQLESLTTQLPAHWMRRLFYGEVFQRLHMLQEALVEYAGLIDAGLSRSAYVLTQMAAVNHCIQDHDAALNLFQQVHKRDPHRIEDMDKYSNTLFVKGMRVELAALAHHFFAVNKFTPETCNIVGNYFSLRDEHDKAVVYFQRALKLDPSNSSSWTLMGHEFMELKKTSAACLAYRNALEIDKQDYRAWYGLGEMYEILKLHTFASYYYNMAHRCKPQEARVLQALGEMHAKQGRISDAIKSYWRAHCVQDVDGIALMKLAKLFEKLGDDDQAAACHFKFLEQTDRRLRELCAGGDSGDAAAQHEAPIDADEDAGIGRPACYRFLAQYWLRRGELDDAHRYALRCLEFNATKEDGKAFLRGIANARPDDDDDPSSTLLTSPQQDVVPGASAASDAAASDAVMHVDDAAVTPLPASGQGDAAGAAMPIPSTEVTPPLP